ncbi:hypothetical protein EYF80_020621 [Liparis tanakae]|uniref:Uncharacterized protein n=1 Tax=Liparis tanakae TaxID=230148 RepID=A0A4Z2HVW6_9TELE|nr:hypothetical protein EYF80_020621 [Liparis tanakae]
MFPRPRVPSASSSSSSLCNRRYLVSQLVLQKGIKSPRGRFLGQGFRFVSQKDRLNAPSLQRAAAEEVLAS